MGDRVSVLRRVLPYISPLWCRAGHFSQYLRPTLPRDPSFAISISFKTIASSVPEGRVVAAHMSLTILYRLKRGRLQAGCAVMAYC